MCEFAFVGSIDEPVEGKSEKKSDKNSQLEIIFEMSLICNVKNTTTITQCRT